jgi:hypothetical protein
MALLKKRTRRGLAAVIAALLCVPLIDRAADAGTTDEYRVKAALLLNFLKFTEWPDAGSQEPLVVGVLLPDPFSSELDQAARAMKVSGRNVEIRRFSKLGDARLCQILFVPRDAAYVAADLPRAGRLTVGETPTFLSSGGIISFYLRDSQVRFEIDPNAAKLAGVHINANVLQLGKRH